MIEKIKSRLVGILTNRRVRLSAISLLSCITIAAAALLHTSAHTIKVFDGETTYTVTSLNKNVASVMSGMKFKFDKYAVLDTQVNQNTTLVEITYGFPVYITQGDVTTEVECLGGTVAEVLRDNGYTVDEHDFVEPALNTQIKETIYIDYTDISYENGTKEEAIPFKTKTEYSSTLNKGTTKVTQKGTNGLKRVSYTQKFVNGVATSTDILSVEVLSNPVDAIKLIGTKVTYANPKNWVSTLSPKKEIELDANGVPVKYKSKMTVRATAYTYTGNKCATGVAPQPGYIAVNPKIIPYGTKMFIKTVDGKYIYGYAVAADTGGFTKKHPTGVDLFFTSKSACTKFGVRQAEIYILE